MCLWLQTQLILFSIFSHFTDVLEAYIKTDGAWIVKLPKGQYTVKTVEDCAVKCNKEPSFTCRCKSDHNKILKLYCAVLDWSNVNRWCLIPIYNYKICVFVYMFFCRSFLYIEKDQDCVTLPANSKTDQILRRMSAALYEKKGKIL